MNSSKRVGEYIRKQRKSQNLTQKDLADTLNISFQAVSKWETGETYPDVSILLQLAEVLNTSTDKILSGGQVVLNKHKFIDVNNIVEGFNALKNLRYYFGDQSTFYLGAIEGINRRMNIDFELYINDDKYKEVMYTEVIIQYLMNGYTMDINDIKQYITSKKMLGIIGKYLGEENTMKQLKYDDNKKLFDQIRAIKSELNSVDTLNQLPGSYINMDKDTLYWATQIETGEDLCYGVAVDEINIYVISYESYGKNQKIIHIEKIK